MKALKAFIKPFEAPKRSVKIKIKLTFISIQLLEMHRAGSDEQIPITCETDSSFDNNFKKE